MLSRREHLIGSPEHPISDMGLTAYRSYWKDVLLTELTRRHAPNEPINNKSKTNCLDTNCKFTDLQNATGIHQNDIVSTLQVLHMIRYIKHRHVVYFNPVGDVY